MSVTIETIAQGVEQFSTKANAEIADLKEKYLSLQDGLIDVAQKQTKAPSGYLGKSDPITKVLKDERIAAFKSDPAIRNASVSLNAPLTQLLKRGLVTGDIQSTTDLYDVQPLRANVLAENPMRPLSILEVLPRLPISSNALEYNRLSGYTNDAAYQTVEGAALAATTMPTTLVTAKIATIGHYLQVSEQVLADTPVLRQQIESLLRYGVMGKAAAEIIVGSGTIDGLQSVAGSYVAATSTPFADAIGEAATQLQIAGWQPNVVVMHPTLWQTIRSDRSATEGLYIAGSWSQPAGTTIWGMNVVLDSSVSATQPLVLDSTQCAILDRQDARIEMGRAGNDFTNATLTVRAMIRIGLAVFSPSAVLQVIVP